MGWSKEARAAAAAARKRKSGQRGALKSGNGSAGGKRSATKKSVKVPVHVGISATEIGHLERRGDKVTAHLRPAHEIHDGYANEPSGVNDPKGKEHVLPYANGVQPLASSTPEKLMRHLEKLGWDLDRLHYGMNDSDEAGYIVGIGKDKEIKLPTGVTPKEFEAMVKAHEAGHTVFALDPNDPWTDEEGLVNDGMGGKYFTTKKVLRKHPKLHAWGYLDREQ